MEEAVWLLAIKVLRQADDKGADRSQCHRLRGVDLTIGTLDESEEPRFMVLIELEQDVHAPDPYDWADTMAKMIRQKWPKDEFDAKVTNVMA